jgi:hypothetical protein
MERGAAVIWIRRPGMQAAATATVTHGAAVPRDFRLPILGLIES